MCFGIIRDALDKHLLGIGIPQLYQRQIATSLAKVHMAINKAGRHHLSFSINDSGFIPDEFFDPLSTVDKNEPVAFYSEGLGFRLVGIACPYFSIFDDDVGFAFGAVVIARY
jgi:hypothetical protein